MARWTEDLVLAMGLLAGPDGEDFTCPPAPLMEAPAVRDMRVAFFSDNGIAPATYPVREAVERASAVLAAAGANVEEQRPPGVENAYELEFAIVGADGAEAIDAYYRDVGSNERHWLAENFVERLRGQRCGAAELSSRWAAWDTYRAELQRFFTRFDAIVCPAYPELALTHGSSAAEGKFKGFSYTMAWNMAGAPAATVRCAEHAGLPVNVQIVAAPWHDLTALEICRAIEDELGGWKPAEGFPAI
jgi:amidase